MVNNKQRGVWGQRPQQAMAYAGGNGERACERPMP